VIDRARIALKRPLEDGDRSRLFALSAALIVAGALILAVIGRAPARPAKHVERRARAPTSAVPAPAPALAPVRAEATGPPSEESRPSAALEVSHHQLGAIKHTARVFLAGYLPFSYGRRSARRIRAASARLRARLAAQRPRVPARERRRRPRVVLLQLDGAGRAWAGVAALIDDRARRYTVPLTLARVGGAWQVTRAGS
jgi:hypothetical protein